MSIQSTSSLDVRMNLVPGLGHFFLGLATASVTSKLVNFILQESCKAHKKEDNSKDYNNGYFIGVYKVSTKVALASGIAAGCASSCIALSYSTIVECSTLSFLKTVGVVSALMGLSALTLHSAATFFMGITCFITLMGPTIGLAGRVSLVVLGLAGSFIGSELGSH